MVHHPAKELLAWQSFDFKSDGSTQKELLAQHHYTLSFVMDIITFPDQPLLKKSICRQYSVSSDCTYVCGEGAVYDSVRKSFDIAGRTPGEFGVGVVEQGAFTRGNRTRPTAGANLPQTARRYDYMVATGLRVPETTVRAIRIV